MHKKIVIVVAIAVIFAGVLYVLITYIMHESGLSKKEGVLPPPSVTIKDEKKLDSERAPKTEAELKKEEIKLITDEDRDEYGCYIPNGFFWCEGKQQCLREKECAVADNLLMGKLSFKTMTESLSKKGFLFMGDRAFDDVVYLKDPEILYFYPLDGTELIKLAHIQIRWGTTLYNPSLINQSVYYIDENNISAEKTNIVTKYNLKTGRFDEIVAPTNVYQEDEELGEFVIERRITASSLSDYMIDEKENSLYYIIAISGEEDRCCKAGSIFTVPYERHDLAVLNIDNLQSKILAESFSKGVFGLATYRLLEYDEENRAILFKSCTGDAGYSGCFYGIFYTETQIFNDLGGWSCGPGRCETNIEDQSYADFINDRLTERKEKLAGQQYNEYECFGNTISNLDESFPKVSDDPLLEIFPGKIELRFVGCLSLE